MFTLSDTIITPRRITIGENQYVIYSLLQDKEIIKCKVEQDGLSVRIETCDKYVNSLETMNFEINELNTSLYNELYTIRNLYYIQNERFNLIQKNNILLSENQIQLKEENKILNRKYNNSKKRNKIMIIVGSVLSAGLVTALILK